MVLSMDRWKGKVAIVTGAGGGIGEAIVLKLLQDGLKVVGIDNNQDRLNKLTQKVQLKDGKFQTFIMNVADDKEVKKLFKRITVEMGPVNILVNTAGIARQGNLIDGDPNQWKQVLDTNVLGLCITTREAVQIMRAHQIDGHIIHICSVAGHTVLNMGVMEMNVYSASKFAVRALTESHRQDFNRLNLRIKVTNVSPGKVNTNILKNNDFDSKFDLASGALEANDIAEGIVYALSTPPHVQIHELTIRAVGEPF